jgi:hypothetical protein
MSLADRPAPEKDELLRCYEKYIKEAAELAEVTPDQRDAFAYLQVKLVRQIIDGMVAADPRKAVTPKRDYRFFLDLFLRTYLARCAGFQPRGRSLQRAVASAAYCSANQCLGAIEEGPLATCRMPQRQPSRLWHRAPQPAQLRPAGARPRLFDRASAHLLDLANEKDRSCGAVNAIARANISPRWSARLPTSRPCAGN